MHFVSKAQGLVVELLSEIFLDCLPEDGPAQIRHTDAPLNVSRVCRHWRYVALSTPRLWSALHLECFNNEATLEYALPSLRVFLQRSANSNFHFKLDCVKQIPRSDLNYMYGVKSVDWLVVEMMLHELAVHAQRIKGLALSATGESFVGAVKFLRKGVLPALHFLSLQFVCGPEGGTADMNKKFWEALSNLRRLELRNIPMPNANFDNVLFPKLQKLVLNCSNVSRTDVPRFLELCPTLKTLFFGPTFYPRRISSFMNDTNRRSFPSIQYLDTVDDRCFLLETVNFPNLRRLVVRSYDPLAMDLENFLIASRPPLEELSLSFNSTAQGESPISLFSLLPTLKKLRLPLSRTLLQLLILSSSGDEYNCPLLEEVMFDIQEMTFEESVQTWTAAEDMIRSRWRSPKGRRSGAAKPDTTMSGVAARSARCLSKIILPAIKEEHWKRHQLYRCIKDCQREGLLVSFSDEDWTSLP